MRRKSLDGLASYLEMNLLGIVSCKIAARSMGVRRALVKFVYGFNAEPPTDHTPEP